MKPLSMALAMLAAAAVGALAMFSRPPRSVKKPLRRSWVCLACGLPNEADLAGCWNCGTLVGIGNHDPSHSPGDRRWACGTCAAWNGIARDTCWRCGTESREIT